MKVLPHGWASLALGFAMLFLGINVGKDVAHKYLPKAVGGQ